ncbi:WD40-repeat-containing domain [Pseudocohnilembus persalinus]|uniref:WD40-repeat-containing domain n=1 Tax=Pseudocohnilembus persalinus TaxID=266149 RepID=A0A0V0QNN9_PSEPJ|nr:WD40-repeat-containing domain [Pseudocohnilembus persalinus]|eukprot:KRX03874.1 WD40-repeat-containing domain [Pseudocohnilembus persalinus]
MIELVQKYNLEGQGHQGPVNVIKYDLSGEYCLSGGSDRTIILWKPSTNKQIKQYQKVHNYEVTDLQIFKDNSRFISCSADKNIFIWDTKTGNIIRKIQGHSYKVNSICMNSDESVIVSGSFDTCVKIWDLKSRSNFPIQSIKVSKDSISKVIVEDHNILISSIDGNVYNLDIRMGLLSQDNFNSGIQNLAMSHDKQTYIASSLKSTIYLVDRNDGDIMQQYSGHKTSQYHTAIQYYWGDQSGSEDGYLFLYDFTKGTILSKIKNNNKSISTIAMCPDKKTFLTGSLDSKITYWDIK